MRLRARGSSGLSRLFVALTIRHAVRLTIRHAVRHRGPFTVRRVDPDAAHHLVGDSIGAGDRCLGLPASGGLGPVEAAGDPVRLDQGDRGGHLAQPHLRRPAHGRPSRRTAAGGLSLRPPEELDRRLQARFFVRNGGGWTADGRTLPGALDLEKNPSGAACYGLSTRAMVGWIRDFTTEYRRLTGRDAVIYVQAGWWRECTGGNQSFAAANPLWLYDHDGPLGPLPPGWERATAWQYGVRESMDRNVFLGSEADLALWARTP